MWYSCTEKKGGKWWWVTFTWEIRECFSSKSFEQTWNTLLQAILLKLLAWMQITRAFCLLRYRRCMFWIMQRMLWVSDPATAERQYRSAAGKSVWYAWGSYWPPNALTAARSRGVSLLFCATPRLFKAGWRWHTGSANSKDSLWMCVREAVEYVAVMSWLCLNFPFVFFHLSLCYNILFSIFYLCLCTCSLYLRWFGQIVPRRVCAAP